METEEQITCYGTGIKTLRGISTAIGFLGIFSSIIMIIGGYEDKTPVFFGIGIMTAILSVFLYAVGRVLATIAEIKLKEFHSKTNIILK